MPANSDPLWLKYEQAVAQMLSGFDPSSLILHNQRVTGRFSGVGRQVDVWAEGRVAGADIRVAVECKRYNRSVGVGVVDEFAGKLQDLDADRGLLYSWSGFTEAAANRAARSSSPRIQTVDLAAIEPSDGPLYASALGSGEGGYTAPTAEDLSTEDYVRFLSRGEWIGY